MHVGALWFKAAADAQAFFFFDDVIDEHLQRILIDPLAVIIGDLNPVVLIRKFLRSSKSRLVIGWPLTTAITRTLSAQTVFGTPVQKTDNVSIIIVKMIVQVLFKN